VSGRFSITEWPVPASTDFRWFVAERGERFPNSGLVAVQFECSDGVVISRRLLRAAVDGFLRSEKRVRQLRECKRLFDFQHISPMCLPDSQDRGIYIQFKP
jgi:hypothetical protein